MVAQFSARRSSRKRERLVDHAARPTSRCDLDVLERGEALRVRTPTQERMVLAHDAHQPLVEQLLRVDLGRQRRIDTDREIDLAEPQQLGITIDVGQEPQADARCVLARAGVDRRAEPVRRLSLHVLLADGGDPHADLGPTTDGMVRCARGARVAAASAGVDLDGVTRQSASLRTTDQLASLMSRSRT